MTHPMDDNTKSTLPNSGQPADRQSSRTDAPPADVSPMPDLEPDMDLFPDTTDNNGNDLGFSSRAHADATRMTPAENTDTPSGGTRDLEAETTARETASTPALPLRSGPPEYPPFVLDCRDGRFLLSGEQAADIGPNAVPPFWHALVVDFFTSPGPGVIKVDGPPKFAPLLAQRALQRTGELTEDLELRAMHRHALEQNKTVVAYQLVPRKELERLHKQSHASEQGVLLHDTVSVLHALLRMWAKNRDTAVFMHLPQTLLVLVGQNEKILWGRRYSLTDDRENFPDSVHSIFQDTVQAGHDEGFVVEHAVWVEGWGTSPLSPPQPEFPLHVHPVLALRGTEKTYYSALPDLVHSISHQTSFTPAADRALARLQPWEKWFWATGILLALLFGLGTWQLDELSTQLRLRQQELSAQKEQRQTELETAMVAARFNAKDDARITDAVQTAQRLQQARSAPPAAMIWNQIAAMRPPSCRIQAMEITYEARRAVIRMEGTVELGLTQAQSVYAGFVSTLRQGGYQLVRQEFTLDLDTNFFSLVLEKPAQE